LRWGRMHAWGGYGRGHGLGFLCGVCVRRGLADAVGGRRCCRALARVWSWLGGQRGHVEPLGIGGLARAAGHGEGTQRSPARECRGGARLQAAMTGRGGRGAALRWLVWADRCHARRVCKARAARLSAAAAVSGKTAPTSREVRSCRCRSSAIPPRTAGSAPSRPSSRWVAPEVRAEPAARRAAAKQHQTRHSGAHWVRWRSARHSAPTGDQLPTACWKSQRFHAERAARACPACLAS
jgi:hypothetical protein